MGLLDQNKVESSSSCKNNGKKRKIFKGRMKGVEKKWHELKTLCGVRVLLYVDSEFNKDKNGDGLVRILPENPNECQEIIKDFINYDPKTAGKRKRDADEEVVDSECMSDNKVRKLCNGDVKEENQQFKFIDQKLSNLSIEEIQRIERNLEPMFGMISERIDQLMMEKNKSTSDPSAKGCNEDDMITRKESPSLQLDPKFMENNKSTEPLGEGGNDYDDMIMMNESPSLQLEPKCDYQSSSPTEFYNYSSALEKEFNYDVNQWLNNTTTDDGIAFEPFPDLIDFEFQGLNNFAGSFTDMINCY
ncbi:hypothetical protein C5167_033311 [Papaver somniferum]|uniref:MADS-box domain-containing protein n=1 Tax=Papaver somniferum TaxID=3469 RepID=A0A4Y7KDE3_PAPSO|nr:hypothetical protein C5167_033311 [Papaver somniferum]